MEIKEIIKDIFNEEPVNYEYIETGLTNDNYIVSLSDRKIVLRVPKVENEGLFDYAHEALVLDMIQDLNLDTKLLYYNKLSGLKCSEYIENSETFQIKYIRRAAQLIRRLHDANLESGQNFKIRETFNEYKSRIKNPIYDTSFAHHYIDNLNLENIRLCHNDLVQGNLLFSDSKDYLIDYEYAKDNDPYFDIMSFITENDIVDDSLRHEFYLAYFNEEPSKETLDKLLNFEIVHHVLWCEWAMMMYDAHHDAIYKEIADLKYKRLIEVYEKNHL